MQRSFTLPQLARAAEHLLARGPTPADERVSAAPDERTLRWYQTTGLLDRPLRYEGRTAIYGWRHLLQAVTVKLLQAEGLPLGEVQQAMAGAPTEQLEAAVRDALGELDLPDAPRAVAEFAAPAAAVAEAAPVTAEPDGALVAAEVAPGITVLVDPRRVADPAAALARIRSLFAPGGSR